MTERHGGWLADQSNDIEFQQFKAREDLIEDFLSTIEAFCVDHEISRGELARRIGHDVAGLDLVFSREIQITVDFMSDMCFHLGLVPNLQLVPKAIKVE